MFFFCLQFQLLNHGDSGQVTFRDFCLLFSTMSKAALQDRLKLLFCCHCEQLLKVKSKESKPKEEGIEVYLFTTSRQL